MDPARHDAQLRQAAFSHVDRRAALRGGVLDSTDLAGGVEFGGERIPLINPQRGIFKPRQMARFLSIRTMSPAMRTGLEGMVGVASSEGVVIEESTKLGWTDAGAGCSRLWNF